MPDAHRNFAYSLVATAPSPAASGTSLVVTAAQGALFPAVPFNATIWPTGVQPLTTNAEIVRVTARSTDTLTITRAQEGSSARTVVVGDQIAATITALTLTEVENAITYRAKNGQSGILLPTCPGWAASDAAYTANRVVATRFVLPYNFTVTSMLFRSAAAGTGNVNVAILDATGARLGSSGSTAGKKGGYANQTVALTATLALTAGTVYYAALESSVGDGQYVGAALSSYVERFFGTTIGLLEGFYMDTTFPIPTPVTVTGPFNVPPIMALV